MGDKETWRKPLASARGISRLVNSWTRLVGAEPTSVTVSKDPAGCFFVFFSTEEDVASLPVVNATVGLDLG